jgi:hypothetical protein
MGLSRPAQISVGSGWTTRRWGALASFLLAPALLFPPAIHLVGDLRTAIGQFAYDLADFLYGPVWGASLVTAVLALREGMGERAPRRISLALLAASLAAGAMVAVACIRSANRHYHIDHPWLHLENSTSVLVVWTTVIAGVNAAGWHFLGWALVLVGSTGWTSRRFPRLPSALYLVVRILSLFVYVHPALESTAVVLAAVVFIWQGNFLWKAERVETQRA